jgi:hypothetical protein
MIDDNSTLPVPIAAGGVVRSRPWRSSPTFQKSKSGLPSRRARTRRAYRLDVQRFMRTLAIRTPEELRQADHKAVIAWERYMRETEHAAPPWRR